MFVLNLINNLAILVALSVLSGLLTRRWYRSNRQGRLLQGVLFGAAAAFAIFDSVEISPGVIFDGRAVLLSLAGYFFGPMAAVIAGVIAAAARLLLGGVGLFTGLLLILFSTAMGIAAAYLRGVGRRLQPLVRLGLFSLLVSVGTLLLMFTLPPDTIWVALRQITFPVMTLYPLVSLLIGKLIYDQDAELRYMNSLAESEAHQRLALEGGQLGAWEWNIVTGENTFNDRWAEMLGYRREEMEPTLDALKRLIHPDDLERMLANHMDHLSGKTPRIEIEFRMRHKDGRWVWVLSHGQVIEYGPGGRPLRAVGTHLDITARKQVEVERELTVELLRLFNNPDDLPMLLHEVTRLLKAVSGCDAVGVRLIDGENYPLYQMSGNPPEFALITSDLCARQASDQLPRQDCLCGALMRDEINPLLPGYTTHGSFWCPSTSQLLSDAGLGKIDLRINPHSRCQLFTHESIALIPLRVGNETLGLVQFADHRAGFLQMEMVEQFERMGERLASVFGQRAAQVALALSQHDLERAQGMAHVGSWSFYPATREMDWSAEMCRIHGLPPAPTRISIETAAELVHPEDLDAQRKMLGRAITGASSEPFEFRLIRPDGEIRTALVGRVEVDKNAKGDALRVFGVLLDITERKQIEMAERRAVEALRESEMRYRTLVDNVGEGIALIDAGHRFVFANPAAGKLLGEEPESLLGRSLDTFVDGDLVERGLAFFEGRPEGAVSEVAIRLASGARRTMLVTAVPQRGSSQEVLGLFLVFRDITEMRENARLLERYRILAENSQDMMWFVRVEDCRVLDPNLMACLEYGYTRDEFQKLTLFDLNVSDTPLDVMRIVNTASTQGLRFEAVHRRRSGVTFPVEVSTRGTTLNGEQVLLSVVRDISERRQSEERIAAQLERLSALQAIDNAIIGNLDLPLLLNVILQQVTEKLHISGVGIWLVDQSGAKLHFTIGDDIAACLSGREVALGAGWVGRIASRQESLWVPHPDKAQLPRTDCTDPGFHGYYGAPLVSKGKLLGVMDAYQVDPALVDDEWFQFFDMLANQSAIAIDDMNMFNGLRRSNQELSQAYEATIEGWSRALDLRDQETEGHSQRVTELSGRLSRRFGFSEEQMLHQRRGALLHDIGKMGVPDEILLKPDRLTPEEWEVMKRHPVYAHQLIYPIEFLRPALDIPYCHHEKWDGSGYPRGLKGEEIPLAARIFAVADVWDAVTSDRPYRRGWDRSKAEDYIREQSGRHFDPRVVEAFFSIPH